MTVIWKAVTYLSWSILPDPAPKPESAATFRLFWNKIQTKFHCRGDGGEGSTVLSTSFLIWAVGGTAGLVIKLIQTTVQTYHCCYYAILML